MRLPDSSERNEPPSARLPDREIVLLLSSSIGLEKAEECVTEAVRSLGFSPIGLTQSEGLAVLELIAEQPGIVGVTARFAKSRVHLEWSKRPPRR